MGRLQGCGAGIVRRVGLQGSAAQRESYLSAVVVQPGGADPLHETVVARRNGLRHAEHRLERQRFGFGDGGRSGRYVFLNGLVKPILHDGEDLVFI